MLVVLLQIPFHKRRIHRPRANTIHPDLRRIVHRQLPRHRHNGTLRRAIGKPLLHPNQPRHAPNIHNPSRRLQQMRHRIFGHQERPRHVHPHQPLKIGRLGIFHRANQPNSGIVHQNVQPFQAGKQVPDPSLIGDVAPYRPSSRQLRGQLLGPRHINIGNQHRRARRRKHATGRLPDTTCTAGHHRDPAILTKRCSHFSTIVSKPR